MTIVTDQATVDRWLADGRWVEFDGGVFEARLGSPDPKGQRLAVQVPCRACVKVMRTYPFVVHRDGLITVAWATVEFGPLPVLPNDDDVGSEPCLYYSASSPVAALWYMKATPDGWHVPLTLPPDVDPQTLIGQWARGGSIEATA